MRAKGKLISWNEAKAYGFIAPMAGGDNIFIHKIAFLNKSRTPKLNDVITYSGSLDKLGRLCANQASFTGETTKAKNAARPTDKFSIYLACLFLAAITIASLTDRLPYQLLMVYWVLSIITYLAYAIDKSRAKRGRWRTPESTLHWFALLGGWPGAALAQQTLRHKSKKTAFRVGFWFTIIINLAALYWLTLVPGGSQLLQQVLTY